MKAEATGQSMHFHFLGVAGTFMGSLAQLIKAQGHQVTGSDKAVYPPMSDQLAQADIAVSEGYEVDTLPTADTYVVGNAISRGNPQLEHILEKGLRYISGPALLEEEILPGRWVLAVAGTHGKTTTASILAWLLEDAGMSPGFLIGGVPGNFPVSARLGDTPFFVIEADEYDTALFDKRSKFVHYHPRTLVMNNLEYDHADIFPDLAAIERQFHHLVRTLPQSARIILPDGEPALERVLEQGVWSEVERFGANSGIRVNVLNDDASHFVVTSGDDRAEVTWHMCGQHNMKNAVAAMLAARHVGVPLSQSAASLTRFQGVKRRLELLADIDGVHIYDDFAHHPTAIATTLNGLRKRVGKEPVIAVIEPRSNTMKQGVHKSRLAACCQEADEVIWYQPPGMGWSLSDVMLESRIPMQLIDNIDRIISQLKCKVNPPCHVVLMSNGSFDGLHQKLITSLQSE